MKNKPTYKELEKKLKLFKDISDKNKQDYEELRNFVNTAPVGLIVTNQRIIEYVNDRFCDLIGYSSKELLGRSTEMCYLNEEEYLRVGRDLYDQVSKFGFGNIKSKAKRKDGDLLDVIIATSWVEPKKRNGSIIFSVSDITERSRAENMLFSIVEGTSTETGRNYFKKLVRHLADALNCEYAQVGILDKTTSDNIKTLAFWEIDKIGKNYKYDLSQTPCEKVVGKKICYHNSKVFKKFPKIKWIVEKNIESYLGIPLFNINDEPIGILTVMGKNPFPENIIDNTHSLLTIFASRAESELQRIIADDELLALAETLKIEQAELSEINVALKQVLDLMEQERTEFKHEIHSNIEKTLMPFVNKLNRNNGVLSKKDIGILEDALKSIIGREADNFRANYGKLTSREIDICELINKEMVSQEIADYLHISLQTVQKHRSSIRKKLQLKNKEIKLSAYLKTKKL